MADPPWAPLLLDAARADPEAAAARLEQAWGRHRLVALAGPGQEGELAAALGGAPEELADLARFGAAVVVGSGGSSGGRHWCLQPLAHLQASADATAAWLEGLGLEPASCLHLDPLPLHHVSGLLPLVRARRWGGEWRWLAPTLLRRPEFLPEACPLPRGRPVLLSLVPTQLARLMASPAATAWLAGCALIWVGGAGLPAPLAAAARRAGLPLAPCYGATETAAMVCALPPQRFLAGVPGCGAPLPDVVLRLDGASGAVEVRCGRLSPGRLVAGRLQPLPLQPDGWWRSGDGGRIGPEGLELLGRLDGALHSGGETVFPERLEERLQAEAAERGAGPAAVLLLARSDAEWGERLVALVRPRLKEEGAELLGQLQAITAAWPPAERPRSWHLCPSLAPTAAGKWQRGRWQRWLDSLEAF
ncbi:acyl-CoA synthetase (AMP-forming)/AMP-acid ligase II [Cyanobium gracile PCC 6307]|uniref:Acyl-CoA synthetase (AMP-forming)/AMP-acid ligase II n=1 Tax=Cyanobium gracile (strain ATCC 27147 / PCC 6307) TaxID=292564 RepID=K9PB32_CYAGP|nr:AMP-binding protein [Cyanobium gracile]AFY29936.1 acyl-CoA synthetase (AMP-forming)/AMP-acid ligase II [Cyanobium gracile PCC 6307]